MKSLILLFIITIISAGAWFLSGFWKFDKKEYLDEKTLEISIPINVTIDTEFLSKLEPAYE